MWSASAVLVCALTVLGRDATNLPPVELVAVVPPYASSTVEAFVRPEARTIHLVTSTPTFREAQRAHSRCGNENAVKKIASILVHEQWHVRHGGDERGAYEAQLLALMRFGLGPGSAVYDGVFRSMKTVVRVRERLERAEMQVAARR